MPAKYDPSKIEPKWQKKWASSKLYKTADSRDAKNDRQKGKYYVLDMFPYPSGEGLHVGHPKGYIATDVISRMKRMQGFNVLHPMGFDAFGLPAENYAIKTKTNPEIAVKKNVARFKEQLEIIGLDYDWSREVNTTDPAYYRWTQWIFLQLWKKGLAYESNEPVNWCPTDKTVLANEDVENGRCERCGTPVEKKPMRQWVLRITDYADRLLNDLDATDYVMPKLIDKVNPHQLGKPLVKRNVAHAIVFDPKNKKYLIIRNKKHGWDTVIIGGIEGNESPEETARREVREETGYIDIEFKRLLGGKTEAHYYTKHKGENRIAFAQAAYFELKSEKRMPIGADEDKDDEVLWIDEKDFVPGKMVNSELPLWLERIRNPAAGWPKLSLDWPESIKEAQRNWIGRSEGALINFNIKEQKGNSKKIEVFTTRPDTLFGVTYVVLAPEHKLVSELLGSVSNKAEVEAYISNAARETEIERTDTKKEKTGVELKGIKAINPANNEEVPVWTADYVLADYGTGAVMAVPAHDERDWEFAKKFGLPIKQVIVPTFGQPNPKAEKTEGSAVIVFDQKKGLYACLHWHDPDRFTIVTGGREGNESFEETAKRELNEEAGISKVISWHQLGSKLFCHYFNRSKNVFKSATSMQFLAIVDSDNIGEAKKEAHEKFDLEWKSAEGLLKLFEETVPNSRHFFEILGRAVLLSNKLGLDKVTDTRKFDFVKGVPFLESGILIDSGQFSGKPSNSVKKDITTSVGGQWVTKYKLRDWVFSRQRYWGEPIPLIHCDKCGVVAVPEKDLPVELPKVSSYEPTGTGESPLAAISKWVNVKCPKCKGSAKRETNTMPQWAGSCWYYLRYEDPKNKKALVDPIKEKYWSPVNLYVGGAEHATRHLIYARFWHKFLNDIGIVSYSEPFTKLQSVGLIMGEDGRKMSKRFGNVVNPDDIVKQFGADTLRIYEMFMGPFDQAIAWSTESMVGPRRFIEKVWRLGEKVIQEGGGMPSGALSQSVKKVDTLRGIPKGHVPTAAASIDCVLNRAIKKVTEDIAAMRFNTAISTLMIAVNELEKVVASPGQPAAISRPQFETLLKLIAPFAPHVTEELWTTLGNKRSIHISEWPKYDPKLVGDEESNIVVQINGKVRASFKITADEGEEALKTAALALPEAKKWLEGKQIQKVIVVKGRLVSIVAE